MVAHARTTRTTSSLTAVASPRRSVTQWQSLRRPSPSAGAGLPMSSWSRRSRSASPSLAKRMWDPWIVLCASWSVGREVAEVELWVQVNVCLKKRPSRLVAWCGHTAAPHCTHAQTTQRAHAQNHHFVYPRKRTNWSNCWHQPSGEQPWLATTPMYGARSDTQAAPTCHVWGSRDLNPLWKFVRLPDQQRVKNHRNGEGLRGDLTWLIYVEESKPPARSRGGCNGGMVVQPDVFLQPDHVNTRKGHLCAELE